MVGPIPERGNPSSVPAECHVGVPQVGTAEESTAQEHPGVAASCESMEVIHYDRMMADSNKMLQREGLGVNLDRRESRLCPR